MLQKISNNDGSEYYLSNDGQTFPNLKNFININDQVEHEILDLSTALESAQGRVDYKIEKKQLRMLGQDINYAFIVDIIVVVVSLVVGIIQ